VAVVERVTLKLDVDTNTSSLAKATGQLKAFERTAKSNDRSMKNMGRSMSRADRRFGKLGRTFQRVGQMATKFFAIFTKFSFIAYAGQVAVLTTALLGAKLAMATGRVAAQGYSIALKGVAAAAIAAATAVSIAAASMRQFQEAQLSPFTGGVGGAAVRNRTVSPMLRGLMGSEVTQQALRGLAKSGVGVSQQNAVLSELFNISGGDSKQMTSLIGAISGDPGTFKEAVGKSAGGAAAAGRAGDLQGQQLIQLLASGGLTSGTGFSGLQNVMGATVIGTLKTEMQSLLSVFADVGEGLLGPTRDTIRLMSSTLTVFFQRSIPLIMKFGDMVLGSNGLASGLQKMSNSLFRLIDKTLPGLEGFVSRMSDMASSTRMFFRSMGNALRPLESGAEVLMSVFGEIFGGMGGNGVLDRFNRTLTQNADTFREFGASIGNVFEAFFSGSGGGDSMVSVVERMTAAFNQFATDVVPPMKEIATTLKDIVLNGLPGVLAILSNLMQVIAPVLGGVSSYAGRFGDVGPAALLMGGMMLKGRFGRRGRQRRADGVNSLGAELGMYMASTNLGNRFMQRLSPGYGMLDTKGNVQRNFLRGLGQNRMYGVINALDTAAGSVTGTGKSPARFNRISKLAGGATMAGGMIGAMSMMNAFGDARATGDTSAFNMLQGAGGGAALGFMLGGPLGALAGGAIGGLGTLFTAGRAKRRRTNNLNRFTQESLTTTSLSAEEALANFNHTLENFEEVAKQGDMSAEELKERLDDLKPVFDDLSRQIETKVGSRVELLTEVFGYAADEADQLARSLNNIDFNSLAAENFNNVARDATGAFGFNVIAADTTANRNRLQQTQGGLEAQIRSMFGGDLDLAAQSEEGMRLIEALYTNIFTQSMLEEGQEARGAEFTAGQMLETIFGPSQFTQEFIDNNIDLLEENKTIAQLIGEGNTSLEVIAERLDFAFGGRAEDVLRDRLGEKFDREFAGNVMGGAYTQARQAYIDQNIGTAMGNMLSISNPITVGLEINGLITEDVKQQIIEIVETQTARMGEDVTDAVNDAVESNGISVVGTRGRVSVNESGERVTQPGTNSNNSNGPREPTPGFRGRDT
jgi:hypothetical protein